MTDARVPLRFTGRASLVVELEDYSPIEFRVDDLDAVKALVRAMLDSSDELFVNSHKSKKHSRRLQKLMRDDT